MRTLIFILFPAFAFGQLEGDLWFGHPGQIDTKQLGDTFFMATDSIPDHQEYLYQCRYEWTANTPDGQTSGTLAYVDCNNTHPVFFEWPNSPDTIYVRKRVQWQTTHGGRWALTRKYKIIKQ